MFSLLCSKSTPGQLITVAVSINRVSGFQKGNLIRVLYDFRTALSTRYQCRFNTNKILQGMRGKMDVHRKKIASEMPVPHSLGK